MGEVAAQAVELPDDEHVALSQGAQAAVESRPVVAYAGGDVVVEVDRVVDALGPQGVALQHIGARRRQAWRDSGIQNTRTRENRTWLFSAVAMGLFVGALFVVGNSRCCCSLDTRSRPPTPRYASSASSARWRAACRLSRAAIATRAAPAGSSPAAASRRPHSPARSEAVDQHAQQHWSFELRARPQE